MALRASSVRASQVFNAEKVRKGKLEPCVRYGLMFERLFLVNRKLFLLPLTVQCKDQANIP